MKESEVDQTLLRIPQLSDEDLEILRISTLNDFSIFSQQEEEILKAIENEKKLREDETTL